jgi:hypothetical protein
MQSVLVEGRIERCTWISLSLIIGFDLCYIPSAKRIKLSIHPSDSTETEDGVGNPSTSFGNNVSFTQEVLHSIHQPLNENDPLLLRYKLKEILLVMYLEFNAVDWS